MSDLVVSIPEEPPFYSLYADGKYVRKEYDNDSRVAFFHYPENAIVFLYYTYPSRREACVVRNVQERASVPLPGLSHPVKLLISVTASAFDKLRRAAGRLNTLDGGDAYSRDDGFYARLHYIVTRRGKLDYFAVDALAGQLRLFPDKE